MKICDVGHLFGENFCLRLSFFCLIYGIGLVTITLHFQEAQNSPEIKPKESHILSIFAFWAFCGMHFLIQDQWF